MDDWITYFIKLMLVVAGGWFIRDSIDCYKKEYYYLCGISIMFAFLILLNMIDIMFFYD